MKINRCVLDGSSVNSVDIFYDEISRQLSFPQYFGRNLDALWDVLTADVKGPVEIIWNGSQFSQEKMGNKFEGLVMLLREVEKQRGDFKLILK